MTNIVEGGRKIKDQRAREGAYRRLGVLLFTNSRGGIVDGVVGGRDGNSFSIGALILDVILQDTCTNVMREWATKAV